MPDFSKRSYQKELLDRNDIPFAHIKQNMLELDVINTYLGGHNITIHGLQTLLHQTVVHRQPITICEIGCGGGDNLRVIRNCCSKKNIPVHLIGIDINPHCIEYAKSRKENNEIEFITSDYLQVRFDETPHIIFSSLFCHHFTNDELQIQLNWMKMHTQTGFFINDLHRHPLAYYSISSITKLFSKSYLVKNDAPLSVLRGFTKRELTAITKQFSITNYQLKWRWAFRWLLIYTHDRETL